MNEFPDPEEINSHPHTAPSKRILSIMKAYDKITDGNMIALEIGIQKMLERCPRFKTWIEVLLASLHEESMGI